MRWKEAFLRNQASSCHEGGKPSLRAVFEAIADELAELHAYKASTEAHLSWAADEIAYLRTCKESTEAALRELSREVFEMSRSLMDSMRVLGLYREPQ